MRVLLTLHNYIVQIKPARGTSVVILHGGPYFPARVPILPVEWGPGVPNTASQSHGSPKFYTSRQGSFRIRSAIILLYSPIRLATV